MWNHLSITRRFIIITVAVVSFITLSALAVIYQHNRHDLESAQERELRAILDNLKAHLEQEARTAEALSALVAAMPEVQQAFARGDRQRLSALFLESFTAMKQSYGVVQFQFHTAPAISFLRLHQPAKFGDDLSSFRHTVVHTNTRHQPTHGLEVGVADLGIRGMVPVTHQGQPIGSVEFGLSFGQPFFDRFKAQYGVDLSFHIDRKGQFQRFATTAAELATSDEALLRQVLQGSSQFVVQSFNQKLKVVLRHAINDYSGTPIGVVEMVMDGHYYQQQLDDLLQLLLLLGVVMVLLNAVAVRFIAVGVVKPLNHATDALEGIAHGDGSLDVRLVATGSSEIIRLTQAFNLFVDKIRDLIVRVNHSAIDLSHVVEQFSYLAEHTNFGVRRQQQEVNLVATAITEMAATVHEVSRNTIHTAQAATAADEKLANTQQIVTEAMEVINRLAADVGEAATMVARVDEDSQRIGSVLDVIRGIAEQTNLLALNAAIEAARAGEQGRGFAVVADEVRSLAQRTQHSTQEIQEMIQRLQGGVATTVAKMKASEAMAQESVSHTEEANSALIAITAAVDTISQMSNQIATASEEQNSVTDELNRNILTINEIAEQTATDAANSSETSNQLANQVEILMNLLSEFRTDALALTELSRAKASHLAWKSKMRSFLDGKSSLSEQEAFSHQECRFGQWYYSEGKSRFGHLEAMKQIEAPHRELHETIRSIIQSKQRGQMGAAEAGYERVIHLSGRIVELIDQIGHQVEQSR